MRSSFGVGAALVLAGSASGVVLFDYGTSNIPPGSIGGCWSSNSFGQNFTEDYTNSTGGTVQVNAMSYWSCFSGLNGQSFQIKVAKDTNADGIPDADVVAPFFANAIAETFEPSFGAYRYDFSFAPISQPNGATYSWGISGNGFEAAQLSIVGIPGGNNQMWQYSGNSYGGIFGAGVGDDMIRLEGLVPAPGAGALLGFGGLAAGRRRR